MEYEYITSLHVVNHHGLKQKPGLGGIGKRHGGLFFPTLKYVVLGLAAPKKLLQSNETSTRSTNQSGKCQSLALISIELAEIITITISLCSVSLRLSFMDSSMNQDKGSSTSRPAAKLKEKAYNRYTPDQNQVLEEFYSRNLHPDASDRKQLGEALGLTDDRIKYWFQNRRAIDRRKSKKSLNDQLKEKNDMLRIEIETLKLTHLTATCDSGCMEHPEAGFSSSSSSSIERLKLENACMKDMIDKMNKQLEKYSGIERRYLPDPDDGNLQPVEGPSNPGISITEPLSDEIDPALFFDHNEEAHQSLD